jgi:hypothetical protein
MSMITEDLPPNTEIRVHLHSYEDEIILIRTDAGIATLGERHVALSAGAAVYVPRGVWHGLRNNGAETLGMTAVYSPPGFEQAFKDRLIHPNRTQAQAEASQKTRHHVQRPVSLSLVDVAAAHRGFGGPRPGTRLWPAIPQNHAFRAVSEASNISRMRSIWTSVSFARFA